MAQLTLVRFREFIREPKPCSGLSSFRFYSRPGWCNRVQAERTGQVPYRRPRYFPGRGGGCRRAQEGLDPDGRDLRGRAAARALRTGKIALLVVPGSARDSIRYVYDQSRSDAVSARVLVDRAVQINAGRADPVRSTDTYVTEAGSRYIDFLIPGLLGMNLMGSSIWGIAFSIVTARSKKLLKRLMATPMSRAQYLLSFLASRLVFLILEVVTLVGFGYWAFGVPLRGSLLTIFLISCSQQSPSAGSGF